MRHLTIAIALLRSCTAAPVAAPPLATASSTPAPAATASPLPTAKALDMSIVPAGQVVGDHALVVQYSQQPGGATGGVWFWDVPLDGTAPRQLVSYNQGQSPLTGYDSFDFSRQLSPEGR